MAPIASAELIAELERTVQAHSPERCAQMLRRVTDLLLVAADRLNQRQLDDATPIAGAA